LSTVFDWDDAYDHSGSVIYLLDPEQKIARCNRAWDLFALANQGAAALASKVVGKSIFDVVPADLRDFYRTAYRNVLSFRRDWWHIFECSAPGLIRVFQMRILPCDQGGVLTINTLIREAPLETAPPKQLEDYAENGIAVMCSHCRRVERRVPPAGWDWVPELFLRGEALVTFRLCDFCTAYHYPKQTHQTTQSAKLL
jgi:hypothetical protein